MEHSAVPLTCIKIPNDFQAFVLSVFEWLLKTGFTVFLHCALFFPETPSDGTEINIVGIEAVKICHFCADDLKNLGLYYHATVVKEPPEGMVTKVTIKGAKKYAKDIERIVHGMKEGLKSLLEGKSMINYFS